jgi:oligopeptide transport system permease protein
MAAYILRRVLWLIPALFFISLVTFGLMHAVQGGPFDPEGWPVPESTRRAMIARYGLDQPLWRQYVTYMRNLLQGDLGVSLVMQRDRPVAGMVLTGTKATLVLALAAVAVSSIAGIGLGVLSALNRNRLSDRLATLVSTLGAAVPGFVLGIFFIYVFALTLPWLPTRGWSLNGGLVPGWVPQPEYMVLPALTLAALPAAYLARITRASLLDVLQQDYLRTARAKGLASSSILWRHAMRNAAIPIVSVLGPLVAALVTGSFIVESVFGVPGIGRLFVRAVSYRDYNVIMGMAMFYATVVVLVNLAVDVAYAVVDPRVRYR